MLSLFLGSILWQVKIAGLPTACKRCQEGEHQNKNKQSRLRHGYTPTREN